MAATISTIVYDLKKEGVDITAGAVLDYIKRKNIKKEKTIISDEDAFRIKQYYRYKIK
ncbi:MAG: hypothetical protein ABFD00_03795 [Chloroherpetonaceae bacterium]